MNNKETSEDDAFVISKLETHDFLKGHLTLMILNRRPWGSRRCHESLYLWL